VIDTWCRELDIWDRHSKWNKLRFPVLGLYGWRSAELRFHAYRSLLLLGAAQPDPEGVIPHCVLERHLQDCRDPEGRQRRGEDREGDRTDLEGKAMSVDRPQGLIEGSGRRGEPRRLDQMISARLDPTLVAALR